MTLPYSPVFEQAKIYLNKDQDSLITDIETLLSKLTKIDHISDYSFLVAPVAKAYEGYLKDFFLKLSIITDFDYKSDRFRVGKTLNPSLRYKKFSVFQKLADLHEKGEELAEILWTAWKFGRNEIFHYFHHNLKKLDRAEAEERIDMILNAIIESGKFLEAIRSINPQFGTTPPPADTI